jgi:hypothetical protein
MAQIEFDLAPAARNGREFVMRNPMKLTLALAALGVLMSVIGCKPAQSRGYETGDGIPAVPDTAVDNNAGAQNNF